MILLLERFRVASRRFFRRGPFKKNTLHDGCSISLPLFRPILAEFYASELHKIFYYLYCIEDTSAVVS